MPDTANPPAAFNSTLLIYSVRVDNDVNGNPQYLGVAEPGASTADPIWRIAKLVYDVNGFISEVLWAGGNTNFAFIWDDHLVLSYS